MLRNLVRLLLVAFLVLVPAAILITGNADWLSVVRIGVYGYVAAIFVGVLNVAYLIRKAGKFLGSDFGESAHDRLMKANLFHLGRSSFNYHFTAIRGVISIVLLLAIGALPLAAMIAIAVTGTYLSRGAVMSYAYDRGGYADKQKRSELKRSAQTS